MRTDNETEIAHMPQMIPCHRRKRFSQSLQVMRKPIGCPDYSGADEKCRRHLMPQEDRNGMLIIVQIAVIKSDDNDRACDVARYISANDIGDANNLMMSCKPIHLRVELFDPDRQRISQFVAYAVVQQNYDALALAPTQKTPCEGTGKPDVVPEKYFFTHTLKLQPAIIG